MADPKVIITIDGDNLKFKQAIESSEDIANKSGKNIALAFSNPLTGAFSMLKKEIIILAGALAGGVLFKSMISEAMQGEKAVNDLTAALASSGNLTKETVNDLTSYAEAMSKVSTASKDAIIQGQAAAATFGQLTGSQIKGATKAALDLSAAVGVDLTTAFEMIGKAANGNTTALSKMGIKISESASGAEKFSEAILKIEQRFGGRAEAQITTFAGSLDFLKKAFSDLLQSAGEFVTKSPVVRDLILFIAKSLSDLADKLSAFRKNGDFFGDIIKNMLQFAQVLNTYVVAPLEFTFNLIKLLINTIGIVVQAAIVGFAQLAEGLMTLIVDPIESILRSFGGVAKLMGLAIGDGLTAAADKFQSFSEGVTTMKEVTTAAYSDMIAKNKELMDNVFNFSASDKSSQFIATLQNVADKAKETGTAIRESITGVDQKWALELQKLADKINPILQSGVINIISKSIQTVGASLVKGAGAFNNFGKMILGILGDLAIQIGTLMIATAIGIEQLKVALSTFNPVGLFVAGAALIAIGGALKAMSDIGENGPSSFGAAGGFGPSAGAATEQTNVERSAPEQKVVVNIQGNVLDRRQTGLEIVDVLNETFGTNDMKVAGIA